MGVKECIMGSRAVISMILVQVFMTGMQLLSRVILNQGTFIFALMTYRHIVAAVFVAPFAFFVERDTLKKGINWLVLWWIFINSLVGISLAMGLFYYGLRDTTATYATNFLNLIPIVTFALSVVARMEKLGLRSKAGRIKIGGTLLCVAGALTYSLYHGKAFYLRPSHHTHPIAASMNNTQHKWLRGSFILAGSCFSYATWFLVQVRLAQVYPSRYWATVLTCIMGTLQSMVIGLSLDASKVSWRLRFDMQLLTIVYSGALATGATFCLMLWTIANRGPTYPSMFNPLSLIFVAISEALFFGEPINVGSILGMFMIVIGLYAFLWGKRNESPSLPPPHANAEDVTNVTVSPVVSPPDIKIVEEKAGNINGGQGSLESHSS